ncbi:MAG: hypothetical protein MHPSP_004735, partial [Paramarteilia canceri]
SKIGDNQQKRENLSNEEDVYEEDISNKFNESKINDDMEKSNNSKEMTNNFAKISSTINDEHLYDDSYDTTGPDNIFTLSTPVFDHIVLNCIEKNLIEKENDSKSKKSKKNGNIFKK